MKNPIYRDQALQKLRGVIKAAVSSSLSDFYRKKYGYRVRPPFSFKKWEDFYKLPLLTTEEFKATLPHKRLFVPMSKINFVNYSAGSRMADSHAVYTKVKEKKDYARDNHRAKYPPIFFKAKRVLLMRGGKIIPRETNLYRNYFGKLILVWTQSNLPLTARLAAEVEIDAIAGGSPKSVVQLFPYLKRHYNPQRIKFMRLSGSVLNRLHARALKRYYPKAVLSMHCGSSEAEIIAHQCQYLSNRYSNLLHFSSPWLFYEVVDRLTGEPCWPGQIGELALTNLEIKATVFIRYLIGDLVKFVYKKGKCSCGKPAKYLQLFGSLKHSVMELGEYDFFRDELEKELLVFSRHLTGNFCVEVFNSGPNSSKTGLRFFFEKETTVPPNLAKSLAKRIINSRLLFPRGRRILNKKEALSIKQAVNDGWMIKPKIFLQKKLKEQRVKIYFIDQRKN